MVMSSCTRDCADCAQDILLLGFADDVDQRHLFFKAKLVKHLSQIGGSGRVDDGAVALPAHRLHHTQGGQRVDEGGRARRRRRAFRQF